MSELAMILEHLEATTPYPGVLATLVRVEGSSYRRTGARLWLGADGRRLGSISGGCLEEDLVARAQLLLDSDSPAHAVVVYDTTEENDLLWGVGLGCHGVVHVLLERLSVTPAWVTAARQQLARRQPVQLRVSWREEDERGTTLMREAEAASAAAFLDRITPPVRLVICGAGDDARPLERLARGLGWRTTIVDPRPAFATTERFPEAEAVCCLGPEEVAPSLAWDPWTVAVIMTHHYRFDLPLLGALLPLGMPYLGLLGPRRRAERILEDLTRGGQAISADQRDRLHAPVGLDLGGDGAVAVALSILAEIQAVLSKRDGRPLRQRTTPIHER